MKNFCPTCGNPILPIEFKVCLDSNHVISRGEAIKLTAQQAELLYLLAEARPKVVPHAKLIAALYGGASGPDGERSVVACQISKMRRVIEPLGARIECKFGQGYFLRLVEQPMRCAA